MVKLGPGLGLLAALALVAGCKGDKRAPAEDGQDEAKPSPRAEAEPEADGEGAAEDGGATGDAAEEPPSPSAEGGWALVNVEGAGVYRSDAEGWRHHHGARRPIHDIAEIGGELHTLTAFGVQRLDAEGRTQPVAALEGSDYSTLGEPRTLVAGGRGLWVLGERGVGRWDGGWTITGFEALGVEPEGASLAVDGRGRAWLAGPGLHRHDSGEGWVAVDLPAEAKKTAEIQAVVADARGSLFAHAGCTATDCALIRWATGQPEPELRRVANGGCVDYPGLATLRSAVAFTGPCGLLFNDASAPSPRTSSAGEWSGQAMTALAEDLLGRIWIATPEGLSILDAKGELTQLPLAKLVDVAGPVTRILVRGAAPLPELGAERRGGLGGTLVGAADQPLADRSVELCARSAGDEGDSPCAGVEPRASATTDAEGTFSVDDLPLANYRIYVEVDGRWRRARPRSMTMRAGMVGNLGKLRID